MVAANLIKFYLSGGNLNKKTSSSLGGELSTTPIFDTNLLFNKVSRSESISGSETYRCLYLVNENEYTLNNVSIYLTALDSSLADWTMGVQKNAETQKLYIAGHPIGGSFTLGYSVDVGEVTFNQTTNPITYSPTPAIQASNIENALNDLSLLDNVVVTGQILGSYYVFEIVFPDFKYQKLLTVESNDILGNNYINVVKSENGSPINCPATDIGLDNQTPFMVEFVDLEEEIFIGDLEPLDFLAIWIKRVIPANTKVALKSVDKFTLNVTADTNFIITEDEESIILEDNSFLTVED